MRAELLERWEVTIASQRQLWLYPSHFAKGRVQKWERLWESPQTKHHTLKKFRKLMITIREFLREWWEAHQRPKSRTEYRERKIPPRSQKDHWWGTRHQKHVREECSPQSLECWKARESLGKGKILIQLTEYQDFKKEKLPEEIPLGFNKNSGLKFAPAFQKGLSDQGSKPRA